MLIIIHCGDQDIFYPLTIRKSKVNEQGAKRVLCLCVKLRIGHSCSLRRARGRDPFGIDWILHPELYIVPAHCVRGV